MGNNKFGIDLGTSNISIYNHSKKTYMTEKNMIAIQKKTTLLAYGDAAFDMYEKAPSTIQISYPLNNGVIADINNMETLIKCFIEDASDGDYKNSDYYIAVPTDVTEVEKRSFYDLIRDANLKAKNIYVVEKAIADGVGLGIDVKSSQGVMIVDVGYNTTEISILSLGGIVLSKLIKTGGFKFDEAIKSAIRREFNLIIGEKSSEVVKKSIKELKAQNKNIVVYGRDIVAGLPMEREIPTSLVDECLVEHFQTIINNVRLILEKCPPELAADIYKNGLYLTGGGSLVSNFAEQMADGTGLKVNMAESAVETVVIGLADIIQNKKYKNLPYSFDE